MTTEDITINGMHCDACEKTITRTLAKEGITVDDISFTAGKARITYDGDVSHERIDALLKGKGYTLAKGTSAAKSAARRTDTGTHAKKQTMARTYDFERTILTNGFLALIILLIVQALLTFGLYSLFPGYKPKYLLPLLYIPIAIVTNIVALWHQRAYRRDVSCMTGMMIGMTMGMMTGFTIGAIVGLINGMFVGSLVGVAAGMIIGIYAGRCCGIMGIMEGMMAGLMSGTMGAMITVMMVNDHVDIFLPILIVLCTVMLGGMMRITIDEHQGAQADIKPWPFLNVLAVSFLAMLIISVIMVIGPKWIY